MNYFITSSELLSHVALLILQNIKTVFFCYGLERVDFSVMLSRLFEGLLQVIITNINTLELIVNSFATDALLKVRSNCG